MNWLTVRGWGKRAFLLLQRWAHMPELVLQHIGVHKAWRHASPCNTRTHEFLLHALLCVLACWGHKGSCETSYLLSTQGTWASRHHKNTYLIQWRITHVPARLLWHLLVLVLTRKHVTKNSGAYWCLDMLDPSGIWQNIPLKSRSKTKLWETNEEERPSGPTMQTFWIVMFLNMCCICEVSTRMGPSTTLESGSGTHAENSKPWTVLECETHNLRLWFKVEFERLPTTSEWLDN